ncbi:MAG: hypothetical protein L0212_07695, partial [Acidobacteria bacterium]|nr:hypothetical protein [Acidobacteriota bacterium]
LVDFNAGHIGNVDAHLLVEALQRELGGERCSFHAGLGYRNLLVLHGARGLRIETVPPQEVQGHAIADYLPYGPDAGELVELCERHGIPSALQLNANRLRCKPNSGATPARSRMVSMRESGIRIQLAAPSPLATALPGTPRPSDFPFTSPPPPVAHPYMSSASSPRES